MSTEAILEPFISFAMILRRNLREVPLYRIAGPATLDCSRACERRKGETACTAPKTYFTRIILKVSV